MSFAISKRRFLRFVISVIEQNCIDTRKVMVKLVAILGLVTVFSVNLMGEATPADNPLQDSSLHTDALQRFVNVYSYVSQLSEADLRSALQEADQVDDKEMSSLVRADLRIAMFQKLAVTDPAGAIEIAKAIKGQARTDAITAIYASWNATDMTAAVSHAKAQQEKTKIAALNGMVEAQTDLNLTEILERASELGLKEENALNSYARYLNAEVVQNPRAALFELASRPERFQSSDIRQLMGHLATQWFREDGFEVIDELIALPTSQYVLEDTVDDVLRNITPQAPKLALDYVLNLSRRDGSLEDAVVRTWAGHDIDSAVEAISAVEPSDLQKDLQSEIAKVRAEQDPRYILQNLDVLPQPVRFIAARVATATIAQFSLREAGEFALQVEDSELRSTAVSWLLPIWSEQEPSTLLDWILSDPRCAPLIEELRVQLIFNTIEVDPVRAFKLALEEPIVEWQPGMDGELEEMVLRVPFDTAAVGLEAQIMRMIAESDTQTALDLLPEARNGESRLVATVQVGNALVFQGDISEALQLVQQLPESNHFDFYEGIASNWMQDDPIGLMESIGEFPTTEFRSVIATQLLLWDRRENTLTEDQKQTLEQHLTEQDRAGLRFQ